MKKLGKKQGEDNNDFKLVWQNIASIVPFDHARHLVETAVAEVRKQVKGKRAGYAWSGGKDSQALRVVCEQAGIYPCVLGMAHELEYPAFLRWLTDDMPPELDVISNEALTLSWLAAHQEMLFPQDTTTAAKWFQLVQHRAQARFYQDRGLDVILLGRRHQDSNYTGKDGTGIYKDSKGVVRYSPIRHWSHEDVLAVCHYYKMAMPPFYDWPNGFIVGTGCWPARQWTGSVMNAWAEVYQIDPSVVKNAARMIPSAKRYLESF